MANKPQDMNELVPFFAFRDNDKYKDDIFVGWNGKGYQIQRGKQVMIPRGVGTDGKSGAAVCREIRRTSLISSAKPPRMALRHGVGSV